MSNLKEQNRKSGIRAIKRFFNVPAKEIQELAKSDREELGQLCADYYTDMGEPVG